MAVIRKNQELIVSQENRLKRLKLSMCGKIKNLKVDVDAEPVMLKPQPLSTTNKLYKLTCPNAFTGSKTISIRSMLNKKFENSSPKNRRNNNKSELRGFNTKTNQFNSVNNSTMMASSFFIHCPDSKTDRGSKVSSSMKKYSMLSNDRKSAQRGLCDLNGQMLKIKVDISKSDKMKTKSMNIIKRYALNFGKLRKLSEDSKAVLSERNQANNSFFKMSTNENSSEAQINNTQSVTVILDNLDQNQANEYSQLQVKNLPSEDLKLPNKPESSKKLSKQSINKDKKCTSKTEGKQIN